MRPGGELSPHRGGAPAPEPARLAARGRAGGVVPARPVLPGRHSRPRASRCEAVAYLEHHPGRIFSTYLWNDYLDWVGRPVFVDGRTELYTDNGVLSQYLEVADLTTDPDPVLRAHDVEYVLWQPGTPSGAVPRSTTRTGGWCGARARPWCSASHGRANGSARNSELSRLLFDSFRLSAISRSGC